MVVVKKRAFQKGDNPILETEETKTYDMRDRLHFSLSAVRSIPFSGTSELSGSLAGRESKCYASKNINAVGFGSRFDFFASTTRKVMSFLSRAAKHSAISRATS